jgi:hypothetical protein
MAEAESVSFGSLAEFLDTLPIKPCPATPQNRYYCTVCERLNKSIAQRCDYSKIKVEGPLGEVEEGSEGTLKFQPLLDDQATTTEKTTDQTGEKVEFKIVTPNKTDQDYPLFEFVQPKDKKIEPIEMELLEDVALEFKASDDEPIEVESLEVAPLDEDEFEDEVEGEGEVVEVMEVEVLEATEVESEDFDTYPGAAPTLQEFKPVSKIPKPKKGVKAKGLVAKRKYKTVPSKVSRKPIKKSKGVSKVPKKKTSPPSRSPRPPSQEGTFTGEPTWTPQSTKTPPKRLVPMGGGTPGMGATTVPTQKRITPVQPRQPQVQMKPTTQPYPTQGPTLAQPPKATKTIVRTPKKVATVRKVPKKKM